MEPAAGRQVHRDQPPATDGQRQEPGRRRRPGARGAWAAASVTIYLTRCRAVAHVPRDPWSRTARAAPDGRRRRDRRRRVGARRLAAGHRGAEPTPHAVALDRVAHRPRDGVRHPRRRGVGRTAARGADGARSARAGAAGPRRGPRRCTIADGPDQADSRLRPRARRARSTARPPRDRIRRRKPWVFLRLRLFGWYVRFTSMPPRATAPGPGSGTAREAGSARFYGRSPVGRNAATRHPARRPRGRVSGTLVDAARHADRPIVAPGGGATLRASRRCGRRRGLPRWAPARQGRLRRIPVLPISTTVDAPVEMRRLVRA